MQKTKPNRQAIANEALRNAVSRDSLMNYATIIEEFVKRGIAPDDITPRVNVFTFNAWLALGRAVRKGEKGVKVVTFVACKSKAEPTDSAQADAGTAGGYRRPVSTHVFHISQTDPLPADAATTPTTH